MTVTALLAHFRRKMSQLCLWTKIRTKQWFVLFASAFKYMPADFLCPKCDNFVVYMPANIKMSWKDVFFFAKIGNISQRCSSVYTTIIVRLSATIHEMSTKMLECGPYSIWFHYSLMKISKPETTAYEVLTSDGRHSWRNWSHFWMIHP